MRLDGRATPRVASHHRPRQVGIRDKPETARVEQLVVPPLVAIEVPAGRGHQAHQQQPVALRLRGDVGAGVMRQRREGVERGAHVELTSVAIEQREVDRHAARNAASRAADRPGIRDRACGSTASTALRPGAVRRRS